MTTTVPPVRRTAIGLRRDVILERMQTDHEQAGHAISDVRDCEICCRRYGLDRPVAPRRWWEVREADGDLGDERDERDEPAWYLAAGPVIARYPVWLVLPGESGPRPPSAPAATGQDSGGTGTRSARQYW